MKKRVVLFVLVALMLGGCVHYVPREDRGEETTAETTAVQTTAETTSAQTSVTDTFPNEAEDGHTKRY